MLDFASALGLEIASATVRSNIVVIVILDCTISFLLRHLDPLGSRSIALSQKRKTASLAIDFQGRIIPESTGKDCSTTRLTALAIVHHNSYSKRLLTYCAALFFVLSPFPAVSRAHRLGNCSRALWA